jgi:hypothetical protein
VEIRDRETPLLRLWRMRIRAEDVELCLENAVDLTEDSKQCKSPAAIAIAELSLEQASLTALLWGRYLLDRHGISERLGRREACFPPFPASLALVAVCSDPRRFTDPEIMEASWDHDASLRHVETALGFMEELAPYVFDADKPLRIPGHALPLVERIGRGLRGQKRFAERGRTAYREFIKRARELNLPRLPEIKKGALYARVERGTGRVTIPEFDEKLFDDITEIAMVFEDVVARALETEQRVAENTAKIAKLLGLIKRIGEITGGGSTAPP